MVEHSPSLQWDLGDTGGTVAVRMPLHPVALEVLRETGPMAVSSANKTGQPPAVTAEEARDQLGYSVRVYLEAGPCPDPVPSTIVDVTGEVPRVLREGAIPLEKLRDVVPDIRRTGESECRPFTVLHVCMGNICRSPMAERLLALAVRRAAGPASAGDPAPRRGAWCTATAPAPAAGTRARR